MEKISLSPYGSLSTTPSPVNRMMASFAADFRDGFDINLGVGYVNDKTIPQREILAAMEAVINDPVHYRIAFNYGNPAGSVNLIDSLKRFIVENRIGGITDEILNKKKMVIGASGVTSLLEGIAQVMKPGIVVTTDPMYYIYCEFLERAGFTVLSVPEDAQGIRTDLIEEKIAGCLDEVSFFYVVTIGNPTSSILSNDRRRELVDIVTKTSEKTGRTIPLFMDTAYELLVHDKTVAKPLSGLLLDTNDLVYELGTLSKILAPGLRIGYMTGPDTPLMTAMVQRINDVGFSASLINQEIAGYLLDHHVQEQIATVNAQYQQKASATRESIDEHLGEYIEEIIGGSAGFYFYLTFRDIETREGSDLFAFCSRTTGIEEVDGPVSDKKRRIIYVPGEFCVHSQGDLVEKGKRQLRISYGYEEVDTIGQGIASIGEAVRFVKSK